MQSEPQTQDTHDAEVLEITSKFPEQKLPTLNEMVELSIANAKERFAQVFQTSNAEKVLKDLHKKIKSTDIGGIDDKEGYAKVKEAVKIAAKYRIAIESVRKEGKEVSLKVGKGWDEIAKEWQSKISPVETDGKDKLDTIDLLKKEAEEKETRDAQIRLDKRANELKENGLIFNGTNFEINEIHVDIQFIGSLDDVGYADLLSKVKVQNEKNIADKKAKDEAEQAEKDKQEAIRIENERKQKELDDKQSELDAKIKAIADAEKALADKEQAQKDLEQKQQREAQETKEKLEREAAETTYRELLKSKALPFEEIGFTFSFSNHTWSKKIGTQSWVISKEELVNGKANIEEIKKEIEIATNTENERIQKEAQEAEEKRKSLLSEQELFNAYIQDLILVTPPTLKNDELKTKVDAIGTLLKLYS